MKRILIFMCAALLLCGCAMGEESTVKALLNEMTVEEKVGQLFFVRPDALDVSMELMLVNDTAAEGVKRVADPVREGLRQYPVGGIVLFGKNIESPEQVKTLLQDLRGASAVPPLFAVDEEGGIVARIARSGVFDVPVIGPMGDIGASGDPESAREACRAIGTYLKEIGFDLDFAPVADVNTDPNSPIGNRAFGIDPALTADMVAAAVGGFQEAGIACTLKHFPGHGNTGEDTHVNNACTMKTWEEMLQCEMLPFAAGIRAGADAVMIGHFSAPTVTGDETPASLSYTVVTDKLREEMGFTGIIITDALNMDAIVFGYSAAECTVLALQAGCDALLIPADLPAAYDAVLEAVQTGAVSMERLDESVERILLLKEKCGLL